MDGLNSKNKNIKGGGSPQTSTIFCLHLKYFVYLPKQWKQNTENTQH